MSEITMNRPVTAADIAAKLGKSNGCVNFYLAPTNRGLQTRTAILIRKTAEEMGYDGQTARSYPHYTPSTIDISALPQKLEGPVTLKAIAKVTGVSVSSVYRAINGKCDNATSKDIRKIAEMYGYKTVERRKTERAKMEAEKKASVYYNNTPFHSKAEQISYMMYLRERGFGNTEIAKRTGLTRQTVRRNIGDTPAELAKNNRVTAQKLRAQKNAARKAYVRNAPIAEYNKKVEEHNALKAKVAQMEQELRPQTSAIEKLAAQKVETPAMNLSMLSPTAIM